MQTTLAIHHLQLTQSERLRLRLLNERLSRYFRKVVMSNWDIQASAHTYAVTFKVHARSGYYRAHAEAERAGEAIDLAFDKVVRQRRRNRAVFRTSRVRVGASIKRAMSSFCASEEPTESARHLTQHGGAFSNPLGRCEL